MLKISNKLLLVSCIVSTLFMTACSDVTAEQIIKKYKEHPRKGGIREDIITHDLLPEMKKDAKQDLLAISYAQSCFTNAKSVPEAEVCRNAIVKKYGEEYSFNPFHVWNSKMKQKVLDFLNYNKASAECYAKANEAKDILPCNDPKDPDF